MKKILNIGFIQILLTVISVLLMAQMSWVGKIGISLFYKEYAILKDPVQSGIAIFIAQLVVIIILHLFYAISNRKTLRLLCVLFFMLATAGLAYTIYDFTEEFSHKMLKSKFHFGFYLIWVGFMITSIYYFFLPKRIKSPKEDVL